MKEKTTQLSGLSDYELELEKIINIIKNELSTLRCILILKKYCEGRIKLNEVFSDNGEHSHFNLIDVKTGENLWSEFPEEDKTKGFKVKI